MKTHDLFVVAVNRYVQRAKSAPVTGAVCVTNAMSKTSVPTIPKPQGHHKHVCRKCTEIISMNCICPHSYFWRYLCQSCSEKLEAMQAVTEDVQRIQSPFTKRFVREDT